MEAEQTAQHNRFRLKLIAELHNLLKLITISNAEDIQNSCACWINYAGVTEEMDVGVDPWQALVGSDGFHSFVLL